MKTRIVIIGAGPGGYVAAVRAAQAGAEVTVIEKEKVGGTCLNWGCIPSKVMKTTADLVARCQEAGDFAVRLSGGVTTDMEALMARKQRVVEDGIKGIHGLFEKHGIRHVNGVGRIRDRGMATAETAGSGTEEIPWDRLILATGTEPLELPPFPLDGETILSSDHALMLTCVPESVIILGGGVIGCEFACILSALGAQVTVVEALDRLLPLPSVDPDCSKVLTREMKKRKIKILTDRTVSSAEKTNAGVRAEIGASPFLPEAKRSKVKPATVDAEKLLICIGRQPLSEDLGLETVGVQTDPKGWILADDRMKTDAEGVYAIGDALGPAKIMLAHVASAEGEVAVENALGGDRKMDYNAVPGAIFTSPEVANVGLTEAGAADAGFDVRADTVLFRSLGKAHVIGEIAGQAKIVSDKASGRVLGVHIIGPHATDLIAEGTLALRKGLTVEEIADTIHAHPTLAEIMSETAFKGMDRPLHAI
jgi:dihydrolipoamide dehydrogenase